MSVADTVILLEVGWRGYWRNRSKGGQHLSMSKENSCLIIVNFMQTSPNLGYQAAKKVEKNGLSLL